MTAATAMPVENLVDTQKVLFEGAKGRLITIRRELDIQFSIVNKLQDEERILSNHIECLDSFEYVLFYIECQDKSLKELNFIQSRLEINARNLEKDKDVSGRELIRQEKSVRAKLFAIDMLKFFMEKDQDG